MIKIQNHTEKVIVVYNSFFSVDIPIGKTVEISRKSLQGDHKLFCRYFSTHNEEESVDYGVKRNRITRRVYAYYERESIFPLVTVFSVNGIQTVTLKEEFIRLRYVLVFKTVRIRKITAVSENTDIKEEYMFLDTQSKSRFLKLMRISVFLLPLAIILLLVSIYYLFNKELDWIEKSMMIIFLLSISMLIFDDVYHYFIARKRKCLDEEVL